jgi:hypothetical protein
MQKHKDFIEWSETPRMKWRAIGFPVFFRRFALSIGIFALVFAGLAILCGVRAKPSWWYTDRWPGVLFMAGVGAVGRFLLGLVPAIVWLSRNKLVYRSQVRQAEWLLADCSAIECTPVNGVLRLTLQKRGEIGRGTKSIVVAAAKEDAEFIYSIFEPNVNSRDSNDPRDFGATL